MNQIEKYGKFEKENIKYFYKNYPEIFQTLSGKSDKLLPWSHYRVLLQVKDLKARAW